MCLFGGLVVWCLVVYIQWAYCLSLALWACTMLTAFFVPWMPDMATNPSLPWCWAGAAAAAAAEPPHMDVDAALEGPTLNAHDPVGCCI